MKDHQILHHFCWNLDLVIGQFWNTMVGIWIRNKGELGSRGSGEQKWGSGEYARLPPMWPRFDSSPVLHVGSVRCWFSPCSEGFSPGSPLFLPLKKTNIAKFQFIQDRETTWKPAKADVASSLNIVIYCILRFSPKMEQLLRTKIGLQKKRNKFTSREQICYRDLCWMVST